MPQALFKTDITTASIGTIRAGGAAGWQFVFKTTDSAVTFGNIFDTANSFIDGATSSSKALMIEVIQGTHTIAIQDMDTLVVDGLTIWLPALAVPDTLYVDTDGNTWFDAALTQSAGGVDALSETVPMTESDFDATDFVGDTITLTPTFTSEDTDNLSEIINISESTVFSTEDLTINLNDYVGMSDSITFSTEDFEINLNDYVGIRDSIIASTEDFEISLNDYVGIRDSIREVFYGDFTEDTQIDNTWVEI
ncbi:MAG: hypothetical protein ACUZ8H_00135 [Candidatus Anammoxibacter sp.]